MSDDMRRISFFDRPRNKQDILHVETDGAVVNIQVGLHDREGRQVTSIRVSPDDASRGGDGNGRTRVRDGSRIVRLHEGEDALPAPNGDNSALDRIARMLSPGGRNLHGSYLVEAITEAVRTTGRTIPDA
jgi:hypothetical protein